jgi:hypothetical protein
MQDTLLFWKILKTSLPPCNGNVIRGTRLMAVPNGNNVMYDSFIWDKT